MKEMVILQVPEGFPCLLAALSTYRAAVEQRVELMRVSKRGHTCDFKVADLERHLRTAARGETWQPPWSIMGNTKTLERWGSVVDHHTPVWPSMPFTDS
jgi:hypothetical protein